MKNRLSLPLILALILTFSAANGQKMLAEGTVTYDITVLEAANKEAAEKAFRGASQILYLKGPKARYEFVSPLRSQAIIYDASTKSAVLLRENGNDKYLTDLNSDQFKHYNSKYSGLTWKNLGETRQIAGHNTKAAETTLSDGTSIVVHYTEELLPVARGYDASFEGIDGLPLQFTITTGGTKLQYTATTIQIAIVSANKFDKPRAGYKQLDYQQ